jgi:hypothetical protein
MVKEKEEFNSYYPYSKVQNIPKKNLLVIQHSKQNVQTGTGIFTNLFCWLKLQHGRNKLQALPVNLLVCENYYKRQQDSVLLAMLWKHERW